MNFKKGLYISFGFHAVVILLMTLKFIFFAPQTIDISQAVRVDMVELPDKAAQNELPEKVQEILKAKTIDEEVPAPEIDEKKIEEKKIKPLPEKKQTPDIDLNKNKQKQKSALDKLKKLSAIEKIKQELKSSDQKKSDLKAVPIKGRVLSAGTKIAGLDKLQSDQYLSQLDAQIKAHWSIPQWMIGKPFKATVWVRIAANGSVISKSMSKSSGNPTYDEYCMAAIDRASPFPPVPEKFSEVYKTDGVSFAFPD